MKKLILITILILSFALIQGAYAAGDIGSVVALRGGAVINRDAKHLDARVKDGIQLRDIVEKKTQSRAKMLFVDDSVLTLGESSRAIIKEFFYSKEKGGSTVVNLVDGKMRSVVGRGNFEVHTATAVAAARGTVIDFEAGKINGKDYTTITCLEGELDVKSIDPTIVGRVILRAGMTVTIMGGQAPPTPQPAVKTAADGTVTAQQLLQQATPINQQPTAKTTTPITIEVRF